MITDRQLAEAALEAGWITMKALRHLVPEARSSGKPFAAALTGAGLDEEQITFLQATVLGLPFALPHRLRIARRAKLGMPWDLQRRFFAVPLRFAPGAGGDTLYIATLPETAAELSATLTGQLSLTVLPVAAPAGSISAAMNAAATQDPALPLADEIDLDTPAHPSNYPTSGAARMPSLQERRLLVTSLADY